PDHYIIQAAAEHDYATVYEREIAARREFGYPPFRRLLRVLIQHENNSRAHAEAQRAADTLRQRLQTLDMTGTRVIGPAPCFFSRVNRLYRWHVILRGPDLSPLRDFDIPRHWIVEVDPVDLL
ncbi:MAG: primosomal protein N', partial [Phototrophicaceae bacterium]